MNQPGVVNFAASPHSVELREMPWPEIGPDQVLLEVAAVGVCGSDLHQWTGTHSWAVNYPVILGHEFAGSIREVGSAVQGWSPGDRAVSETAAVIDPSSPFTRQGKYNLDPNRLGFGYGVNGAMTRYVAVPARCLHRIPDGVPWELAALTEPCCVAYNAVVMNAQVRPGDRVLVYGPGPIGLLCAAVARLQGAEVAIVGLERDRVRLNLATKFGCEAIVGDATEWSRAVDGQGVDGVVDAAGVSATLNFALKMVRPDGWISKVGWGPEPLGFSMDDLVRKNVTLRGSFSHNWPIWERVVRLIATGALPVGVVLGGTWPLEQWHEAFEAMHSGEIAKAVLKPGG
ncbi:MAG: zinc-binding dehydrogenase [Pirellulales bacterium]